MSVRLPIVVSVTLLSVLVATHATNADVIAITSGSAHVAWDDPSYFDLSGEGTRLQSFTFAPVSPQRTCMLGCAPGTMVNLSTVFGGVPLYDLGYAQTAIVNGTPYTTWTDTMRWLRLAGQLTFTSSIVTLPAFDGGRVLSLAAPFVFDGQVSGFRDAAPLFAVTLSGSGTARLRLIEDAGEWRYPEVTFDFEQASPVPEPATLLLIGGGLAAARWRRRSIDRTPRV